MSSAELSIVSQSVSQSNQSANILNMLYTLLQEHVINMAVGILNAYIGCTFCDCLVPALASRGLYCS